MIQNKLLILIPSLILALFFSINSFSNTEKKSLIIDLSNSKNLLKWEGAKALINSKHYGTLKLSKANLITNEKGELTGGEFTVDMKSLNVEDLKDPSQNAKLKGHLFSDDFFSIDKYPEAKLKITKIAPSKDKKATHTITGDLTIKNKTHSIEFPAKIKKDKKGITTIQALIPVDRTKWDIRYNSGKFFTDLAANSVIKDEFTVELNLSAQ
jgi:polyisoprenoid-binding protein YceI